MEPHLPRQIPVHLISTRAVSLFDQTSMRSLRRQCVCTHKGLKEPNSPGDVLASEGGARACPRGPRRLLCNPQPARDYESGTHPSSKRRHPAPTRRWARAEIGKAKTRTVSARPPCYTEEGGTYGCPTPIMMVLGCRGGIFDLVRGSQHCGFFGILCFGYNVICGLPANRSGNLLHLNYQWSEQRRVQG
jgi:hypothetical protein